MSKDFPTEAGVINVSSTDMRKMTAGDVAETKNDATVRVVSTHKSQDFDTTKRYYHQLHTDDNSLKAFQTVNEHTRTTDDNLDTASQMSPELLPAVETNQQASTKQPSLVSVSLNSRPLMHEVPLCSPRPSNTRSLAIHSDLYS